jgi:hypothetical protein
MSRSVAHLAQRRYTTITLRHPIGPMTLHKCHTPVMHLAQRRYTNARASWLRLQKVNTSSTFSKMKHHHCQTDLKVGILPNFANPEFSAKLDQLRVYMKQAFVCLVLSSYLITHLCSQIVVISVARCCGGSNQRARGRPRVLTRRILPEIYTILKKTNEQFDNIQLGGVNTIRTS